MSPTDFIGTLPGWITALSTSTAAGSLIIAYWKRGVKLRQLSNEDRADHRDHIAEEMAALRQNVHNLRDELHRCESQCREEISKLTEEIWGEKRQRVAEQISLINTILNTVDAPQLKTLLATLESIQTRMVRT
jgi:hypothetical protein